jgi:hypothetical protein
MGESTSLNDLLLRKYAMGNMHRAQRAAAGGQMLSDPELVALVEQRGPDGQRQGLLGRLAFKAAAKAEASRRRELGSVGRTRENALFAVGCAVTPADLSELDRSKGLQVPGHGLALLSNTLEVEKYTELAQPGSGSALRMLESPRFGFAMVADTAGNPLLNEHNDPRMFLVGTDDRVTNILAAHELTDEFFQQHDPWAGILEDASFTLAQVTAGQIMENSQAQ